jgi:MFS family permease
LRPHARCSTLVAMAVAAATTSPRAILGAPGIARTYGTSLIARLPMGAHGLVLLLFVHQLTGSYALGGAASGAFALSLALSSPPLGRLIDRYGQTPVLVPLAFAQGALHLALATAPGDTPAGFLIAGAVLTGLLLPPMSAAARALWADLLDRSVLPAAYALEAAVLELVYIFGPLVIVGIVASFSLRLALLVNGACVLVGTLWFASSRQSRHWRGAAGAERHWSGPLASRAVRVLLVAIALVGVALGAMEVGIAAVASASGTASAAGPILAASGAGSLIGGLLAGRFKPTDHPARRFAWLLLALAVGMVPWALAPSLVWLGVAVFIGSIPIAPAFATSSALIGDCAPEGTVTEAFTWNGTSLSGGLAIGAAATGLLANETPHAPLAIAAVLMFLATFWVVARDRAFS